MDILDEPVQFGEQPLRAFLRVLGREARNDAFTIPPDPSIACGLLHHRTCKASDADNRVVGSGGVSHENHHRAARNASVGHRPRMAEISPNIVQAKTRVLADRLWLDYLDVGPRNAREEFALALAALCLKDLPKPAGKILSVAHQGEDRVPSFRSQPPPLHAAEEIEYRPLTDLGVALDEVRSANALLFLLG